MSERVLEWLAQKASDYLVWMHEREEKRHEPCPDCGGGIGHSCVCAENDDRSEQMRDVYDAGWNDALDNIGER
jgi:hypothetical protein